MSTFQYNTVEGLVTNFAVTYRKTYEDRRTFSINPTLRYGFSNKEFQAKLAAGYTFNPYRRARIGIEGGRFVRAIKQD